MNAFDHKNLEAVLNQACAKYRYTVQVVEPTAVDLFLKSILERYHIYREEKHIGSVYYCNCVLSDISRQEDLPLVKYKGTPIVTRSKVIVELHGDPPTIGKYYFRGKEQLAHKWEYKSETIDTVWPEEWIKVTR